MMSAPPLALHIPDGFLSGGVAAATAAVALVAVIYGLRVADRQLDEARVPLLGVCAAFVFAAQMLNFPVAGGTSGHFLGATLAAVLLGPSCSVVARREGLHRRTGTGEPLPVHALVLERT